ncbi:MAG: hypothetical protein U9O90_01465 [Euryarchaeota archaeon]|nr:hypothetical protein [Euryarchaeota archaeon]
MHMSLYRRTKRGIRIDEYRAVRIPGNMGKMREMDKQVGNWTLFPIGYSLFPYEKN